MNTGTKTTQNNIQNINNFTSLLQSYQHKIDTYMAKILPAQQEYYPSLAQAMHYAVYNGGKRLRPTLVYLAGELFGAELNKLNTIAAAVELVHCFSLVHDDLPAMDNSDLRRGKPSCHKAFREDIAILTGDAMLTQAFELLSNPELNTLSDTKRIKIIQLLCEATGAQGMVAGQVMDVNNCFDNNYSLDQLKRLHQLKTGALIKNSVLMGASAAIDSTDTRYQLLSDFGETIGLLYQVCDDILDTSADISMLGKPSGTDKALGKKTYTDLLGLEPAKQYAEQLKNQAIALLTKLNNNINNTIEHLMALTNYIYGRSIDNNYTNSTS